MIRVVHFSGAVTIPGGADYGAGAPRGDLRDQSFAAADGWDIREVLPGVFSLHRAGMPEPCTVGGYGYSVVTAPNPADVEAWNQAEAKSEAKRKGKR
jgi:hypothetical protein